MKVFPYREFRYFDSISAKKELSKRSLHQWVQEWSLYKWWKFHWNLWIFVFRPPNSLRENLCKKCLFHSLLISRSVKSRNELTILVAKLGLILHDTISWYALKFCFQEKCWEQIWLFRYRSFWWPQTVWGHLPRETLWS